MILVDIYIPALDKTYDFHVDENVPVGNLIMEIAEMIGNETKSGNRLSVDKFLFVLYGSGADFPEEILPAVVWNQERFQTDAGIETVLKGKDRDYGGKYYQSKYSQSGTDAG